MVRSAELLGWALGGIEREIAQTRERLTALTAQANRLRARLGRRASSALAGSETSRSGATTAPAGARKRRKMSAEARRRISEGMRKRWAERRKPSE